MELVGKPTGPEDVITDHGDLQGLNDDDHAQYHNDARGDARYWPLSTDLATQAELDAHVQDISDAHDASAISVADSGGNFDAVNVEDALTELVLNLGTGTSALDAHLADASDAHDASAISVADAGGGFAATNVEDALAELDAQAGVNSANLNAHITDADAAHAASAIAVTPFSSVEALTVQDALEELLAEATSTSDHGVLAGLNDDDHPQYHTDGRGDARYWKLTTDLATQAELDAHVNDIADAHDASAVSVDSTNLVGVGTNVQTVVEELDDAIAGHIADGTAAHQASAISVSSATLVGVGTDVQAVFEEIDNAIADHLADATDAHDASAISVADAGGYYTATDVEGALQEVAADVAAGTAPSGPAGGVLSGTYPNPGFAADMATQAELDAHTTDATDAHDASAISVADAGGYYTGAEVETALQEIGATIDGITGGGTTPSGPAGGVLDGTYPNPGLAASVAGAALAETANVLDVQVDGSTIEVNADALRVKDAGVTVAKLAAAAKTVALTAVIDGGGSAITTGVKGYLMVPFACTITKATLLAEQSGSIVIDIWKDTYANYPPLDADSITAAAPPTISGAVKSQDTTLTGWTTSISAGDILCFNVDSVATVELVTLVLEAVKA